MNYDTEAWYKLYIRESTEDKVLPVLNRALRDFLLRSAKSRDDATIMRKTDNPAPDLARALGAHPGEEEQIAAFITTMLEDGYLSHRKGRLWITNFVAAQAARSPGARRQQKWRAGSKGKPTETIAQEHEHNESVSQVITRDVSVASRETSPKIRSDPRREETKRDEETRAGARPPPTSAPETPDPEPDSRETVCPLDLLHRPGVQVALRELAEKLPAPLASLEAEAREFVSYWTLGEGQGKTRSNWPKVLRERLRKRHVAGELRPPGAIEHGQNGGRGMSAEAARFLGLELRRVP